MPPRPKGLISSAARISLSDGASPRGRGKVRQWQAKAKRHFYGIGEVHYALTYFANLVSRIEIFVATRSEQPGDPPVRVGTTPEGEQRPLTQDEQTAVRALDALSSDLNGHADILSTLSLNWNVVGECYLIGADREDAEEQAWYIRSIDEVKWSDGVAIVELEPDEKVRIDPDSDDGFIARLWDADPFKAHEPDSPMRAIERPCEELERLAQNVGAVLKSRVPAGMLIVSDSITVRGADPTQIDRKSDPILDELVRHMSVPLQNPESAASVVPLVMRVPDGYEEKIRYLQFDRPLDAFIETRTERAISRIAHGLPVPPEIVTGFNNLNHWTSLMVPMEAFQANIEPVLIDMLDDLTRVYLQPVLEAQSISNPERYLIDYDPSQVISRPNRSAEATTGLEQGAISEQTWRREHGWGDADKPEEEERRERLLIRRANLDPDITSQLIRSELDGNVTAGTGNGNGSRPSGTTGPTGDVPAVRRGQLPDSDVITSAATPNLGKRLAGIDASLRERLATASDAAIQRALERAGARIRSAAQRDQGLRASIADCEPTRIGERLGPAAILALGLGDDDLVVDSVADLRDRFDRWVRNAQEAALGAVAGALGADVADLDTLRLRQAVDREEAWAWLEGELTKLARSRIFDPTPSFDPLGEFDEGILVPYATIREAVARAGGAEGLEAIGTFLTVEGGTIPAGGVGTGQAVLGYLRSLGYVTESWLFEYGDFVRSREFEPHRTRDGLVVESFEDPRFLNTEGWPPVQFYSAGDHAGCRCQWVPTISGPGLLPAIPEALVASDGRTT